MLDVPVTQHLGGGGGEAQGGGGGEGGAGQHWAPLQETVVISVGYKVGE